MYKKNISGLTLIEILVGIVLMGIIIMPVNMLFSQSINQTTNNKNSIIANQIAQKYIEELKSLDYNGLINKFTSSTPTDDETNIIITNMAEGYKRSFSHKDTGFLIDMELTKTKETDIITLNNTEDTEIYDYELLLDNDEAKRIINITYTADNKILIEESTRPTIEEIVQVHKLKVLCKGQDDSIEHMLNIYNKSSEIVNINVVKYENAPTNVNLINKEGEISSNISTIVKSNEDIVYTIKITIKEGEKIISKMESTKRNEY